MAKPIPIFPPKYHILCVDDYEPGLDIRRRLLEAWGYRVSTALTPEEGLAVLKQTAVDAVILDYELGHPAKALNGEQVVRLFKDDWPQIPIILYSGQPNIPECVKHRADAFVEKGGKSERLRFVLAELLHTDMSQVPILKVNIAATSR